MKESDETKKQGWNHFVIEQGGSFLQSWEWGEFQKSIGREVFYLRDAQWCALVIKYQMPLGRNYLFCPHGPIIKNFQFPISNFQTNPKSQISNFLNEIKNLAKQEKAVFLRVEPCVNCTKDDLNALCFEKSKDIQPHKTLVLGLDLSEDELLAQMGEKTRYNLRLSERKGITVKNFQFPISNFQINEFWELMSKTSRRQKIRLFPKGYYKKQLDIQGDDFKNLLFIAYHQCKPIAANMVNIFGQTATYVHGGSDNEFRALMAPHLLQWEQIKYAKVIGCKNYDFYGCDEEKWPGVSRFKKGFGGREVSYCGTHDYVFDKWWYRIYKVARSILR